MLDRLRTHTQPGVVLLGAVLSSSPVVPGGRAVETVTATVGRARRQEHTMPTLRSGHSAIVADDKIFVIGGFGAANTPLATVEVYEPKTGEWSMRASMPTPRGLFGASVVGRKIYVIGGTWSGPDMLATVEVYDLDTDTWARGADMPTARNALSVSAVGGQVYAIGGWGAGPPSGGWVSFSDPGAAARYVLGAARDFGTVEVYDPEADLWTTASDMPTPRSHMATSVVDGRIFAIGGLAPSAGVDASSSVGSDTPLARVEVYDPVSNTWAIATPMTTPRWSYGSVVVDGRIFVIGGTTSTGGEVRSQDELLRGLVMLDVVEEYDPRGGQWSTRSSLDGPRGWLSTSAVGGTIYVIGGRTEAMGGALGDVEIYGPRP